MRAAAELDTHRMLLRQWRPSDEVAMGNINSDPEVTRYLNRPVGTAATRAFYAMVLAHWEEYGFGFWAVQSQELENAGAFLGFIGAGHPNFLPELSARVEIGWRLARSAWGRGLATEGAGAVRDHLFEALGLPELISIIHPENARSQAVARKLGMSVSEHVHHPVMDMPVEVWRITKKEWAARAGRSTRPD
ncbi:MAG: GNAT family N-acetyltransferase [Solirubrobacteraceae bacterium]